MSAASRATRDDVLHLQRALELAEPWMGATRPNPAVGCVLVSADGNPPRVIAEGWHERPGEAHAEAMALQRAGAAAHGCTAVVTLEPCSHHGRTPPCAAALIAAGVTRVVFGVHDPHSEAKGGADVLRASGITVITPDDLRVLDDPLGAQTVVRAERLVAPFVSAVTRQRPWIVAKWAMTLDGRIATHSGDSKWITGDAARAHANELRARLGAVAVGAGTLLADDPLLTYRGINPHARQPARIVFGGAGKLTAAHQLAQTAGADQPVIQVVSQACDAPPGVTLLIADNLPTALNALTAQHGVQGLLVEGGSRLLGSLMDAGLIDHVTAWIAPRLVGGQDAPGPLAGTGISRIADAMRLENVQLAACGSDWLIEGDVRRGIS